MQTVLGAVLAVAIFAFIAREAWHASDAGFHHAYDKAARKDMAYFRAHPGCSYFEAHQYRDKVLRKYHR